MKRKAEVLLGMTTPTATPTGNMFKRPLGKTGLMVAEIGYGAWGIGGAQWVGADDAESTRALERYLALGGNFIDTALAYAEGHSEKLVGEVARRNPGTVVASKIPPKNRVWPAQSGSRVQDVFPGEYVRKMTETSLSNLGMDTLDVQQFHVWDDSWLGQGDWQEAVTQLRRDGKVGHFGISINDHQPDNAVKAVEAGVASTVQVIYNVFDQTPRDRLLDACRANGVGVIVRVALDEGSLSGHITPETTFDAQDWRNMYFGGDRKQELQTHLRAIEEDLGISTAQLPETALRFVLSHPAVSTVIVGMRSVRNVERNAALADGKGLGDSQLQKLYAHRWDRNWYTPAE